MLYQCLCMHAHEPWLTRACCRRRGGTGTLPSWHLAIVHSSDCIPPVLWCVSPTPLRALQLAAHWSRPLQLMYSRSLDADAAHQLKGMRACSSGRHEAAARDVLTRQAQTLATRHVSDRSHQVAVVCSGMELASVRPYLSSLDMVRAHAHMAQACKPTDQSCACVPACMNETCALGVQLCLFAVRHPSQSHDCAPVRVNCLQHMHHESNL